MMNVMMKLTTEIYYQFRGMIMMKQMRVTIMRPHHLFFAINPALLQAD